MENGLSRGLGIEKERVQNFVSTVGLKIRQLVGKLDRKPIQCHSPIFHRQGSPPADILQPQVNQFQRRFIRRKRPAIFDNFSQTHIHRLNRVSHENHSTKLFRVGKENRYLLTILLPQLHERRLFSCHFSANYSNSPSPSSRVLAL